MAILEKFAYIEGIIIGGENFQHISLFNPVRMRQRERNSEGGECPRILGPPS